MKRANSRFIIGLSSVSLCILLIFILWAFTQARGISNSACSPLYSISPVAGNYPFVANSGTVVNTNAYSYLIINLSRIHAGDKFYFVPSVECNLKDVKSLEKIEVTWMTHNVTSEGVALSLRIHIPFSTSNVNMSVIVSQRMIPTGVASVGNQGSYIYIQPEIYSQDEVKLYIYIGPYSMGPAPL
jgi:hypothetical protein